MLIRPAADAHSRAALGSIIAAAIPGTSPAAVPPIDGERENQEVIEQLVGIRPGPAVVLVAENDAGEIIGGIVSQPDIHDIQHFPEDYRRGWVRRVSLLSHIAVVVGERGRGVARELIAETEPLLRADGAK